MSFIHFTEKEFKFAEIFRVIISGSSGVGKTYLVKQLIQARLFKTDLVVLFHPDACESDPTDWHNSFNVIYKVGLPDVEYLKSLPEYTTIVIDDQFDKVTSSSTIDYLVRVLSSKRKLHVFLLTQHYFAKGPLGVSIRDSCNYHVLMYGSNNSINRVASFLNLKKEVKSAEQYNLGVTYPYIFIARDNHARSVRLQVFTDVLSKFKSVIIGQMKYYLLSETDFQKFFSIKSANIAEFNAYPTTTPISTVDATTTTTTKVPVENSIVEEEEEEKVEDLKKPENESEIQTNCGPISKKRETGKTHFKSRRDFEKQVRRIIQRYKIRASL